MVRQTVGAKWSAKMERPLLDYVFGLNARLGRLQFFLASIALAIVMAVICFAIAINGLIHFPKGIRPEQMSWALLGWPILGVAAAFFMLATFTLQAMRIRDIGWDPVVVIGGWIALMVIDVIVATKMPSLALEPGQHTTIMSGLVNFVMTGILLFWPGNDA
jgi:uncharacterized membrane protein YhaH (DUF805 family)